MGPPKLRKTNASSFNALVQTRGYVPALASTSQLIIALCLSSEPRLERRASLLPMTWQSRSRTNFRQLQSQNAFVGMILPFMLHQCWYRYRHPHSGVLMDTTKLIQGSPRLPLSLLVFPIQSSHTALLVIIACSRTSSPPKFPSETCHRNELWL
ncbi:hypothetical protein GALMADRAFT_221179 [Galerina marginata CBS 339.88]|uniref:Uncharacterized protein n=1 Tax=Galerina marginata (strain CBS 339.88) TaxID=685588 RepID=A0A067TLQ2_GALM3|nr:hypothetical protein GALMADRAFT_221179 [Galerina marginata CBS 339.88]